MKHSRGVSKQFLEVYTGLRKNSLYRDFFERIETPVLTKAYITAFLNVLEHSAQQMRESLLGLGLESSFLDISILLNMAKLELIKKDFDNKQIKAVIYPNLLRAVFIIESLRYSLNIRESKCEFLNIKGV